MLNAFLALAAVVTTTPDFAERLRADAAAFRSLVTASHPGPVNTLDPGFSKRLDAAYAQALRRARTTRTYPQYSWALNELTSAFDDGHLGIMAEPKADADFPWSFSWPGFMTELAGDKHKVPELERSLTHPDARSVRWRPTPEFSHGLRSIPGTP